MKLQALTEATDDVGAVVVPLPACWRRSRLRQAARLFRFSSTALFSLFCIMAISLAWLALVTWPLLLPPWLDPTDGWVT